MRVTRFWIGLFVIVLFFGAGRPASADSAGAWHAAALPGTTYSRSYGRSADDMNGPTAIALDSLGNVYITDTLRHRVQKYGADGRSLARWGSFGTAAGQFNLPNAIALDAADNVYVVDAGNNRVQKFDSAGHFLLAWGSAGAGNGQFAFGPVLETGFFRSQDAPSPGGIAADKSGKVYVSDGGNKRIQIFDSSGTYLSTFTQPNPNSRLENGPLAVDSAGNLTVVEETYDAAGTVLHSAYSLGCGLDGGDFGQRYVSGVAVDDAGNTYISDLYGCIQIFDKTSKKIHEYIADGIGKGLFLEPCGIAHAKDGTLFVLDREAGRVLTFSSTTGKPLGFWGVGAPDVPPLDQPRSVAVDTQGNVYIADTLGVLEYRADNTYLRDLQPNYRYPPRSPREFEPVAVAVDAADNVYVLASGTEYFVNKFDQAGNVLLTFAASGRTTIDLRTPLSLAVDTQGNVFVVDAWNNQIKMYNAGGYFVKTLGGYGDAPGKLRQPTAIAFDKQSNIYVLDRGNSRIQKFSRDGTFLLGFGSYGKGAGQFGFHAVRDPNDLPTGSLAVAPNGTIYVGDPTSDWIQAFDSKGQVIGGFGGDGLAPGQFAGVRGMATDAAGNLFVADTGNDRVQQFQQQ